MRHVLSGSFVAGILIFLAAALLAKPSVAAEQRSPVVKGMHFSDPAERLEFVHGMMKAAPTSMIATPDGSIIVLMGGKLRKFDKNLNLIKEIIVDPGLAVAQEAGHVDAQKKSISSNSKNHKK